MLKNITCNLCQILLKIPGDSKTIWGLCFIFLYGISRFGIWEYVKIISRPYPLLDVIVSFRLLVTLYKYNYFIYYFTRGFQIIAHGVLLRLFSEPGSPTKSCTGLRGQRKHAATWSAPSTSIGHWPWSRKSLQSNIIIFSLKNEFLMSKLIMLRNSKRVYFQHNFHKYFW